MWDHERIKSLRRRKGWSQAKLAEALRCTTRTVKRWENPQIGPPTDEATVTALNALESVADDTDETLSPAVEREPASRVLREKITAALFDLPVSDLLVLHAQAKRMQARALASMFPEEFGAGVKAQSEAAGGPPSAATIEAAKTVLALAARLQANGHQQEGAAG